MLNQDVDILFYIPFDKEKLNESDIKWITNLKFILEISLSQILKRETKCLLKFESEPLVDAKVYIQSFINSDYNKKSVLQNLKSNNDINVFHIYSEAKSVVQTKDLTCLRIYNFFDEQSGKILDLTSDINDISNNTWLKISDISYEIGRLLKTQKTKKDIIKDKIYFAETSNDQIFNRNTLIREFKHQGYKIVPEKRLSNSIDKFSSSVQTLMEESIISIHLIGNNYAPLLDNIEISKVELQNDIFNEVVSGLENEKGSIQRLVLIPPNIKPKSEKQRNYIESFKRNIELHKNTEIIQTPIEDFKSIIQKRIDVVFNKSVETIKETSGSKNKCIYIINNDSNNKSVDEIKKSLQKQNIDHVETQLGRNKIELIKQHHRNLITCDGVIIVYSSQNEQWLNSKLIDIIKAPGIGRTTPFLLKAILVENTNNPNITVNINDLLVINTNNKKEPNYMDLFLDKIK